MPTESDSLPDYTLDRVHAALAGEFDPMMLSESEWDYFDDAIGAVVDTLTPAGRIFWAKFDRSVNTDR